MDEKSGKDAPKPAGPIGSAIRQIGRTSRAKPAPEGTPPSSAESGTLAQLLLPVPAPHYGLNLIGGIRQSRREQFRACAGDHVIVLEVEALSFD